MDFERQQGFSLLCSAYPESDVSIELWDYDEAELCSGVTVQQFEAEVESITHLTHDIRGIQLRVIEPATLPFRAGQYIDLLVPGTGEWRSYSMANPPSRSGEVEIMIKLMPGGLFSAYVEQQLKPGERLTLQGPYGNFYLRDTGREALFIAGGSGMAPILCLLRDMAERKASRPVTYFYGARARRDLFQLDELSELERRLPQFRFIPALSEPLPDDAWEGERGLITEVVKRLVPGGSGKEAYMCGPTRQILPINRSCFDKLSTNGFIVGCRGNPPCTSPNLSHLLQSVGYRSPLPLWERDRVRGPSVVREPCSPSPDLPQYCLAQWLPRGRSK
jgi:propane monooxygenase reductase subunit